MTVIETTRSTGSVTGALGAEQAVALSHLDVLESEAVHVLREVVAEVERPALLFSAGKDSVVLLHLAVKAFWPAPVPFPVLHVDTGHNFPEVMEFRDRRLAELGVRLEVASVPEALAAGRVRERPGQSRNQLQSVPLLDAVERHRFGALFGGARRDEDKARAKERVVSVRDEFGSWDPKAQRPELWSLYNVRHAPGEHLRVFPLSNWTELDVWAYIVREGIEVPSIYYSHTRPVVERDGMLLAVDAVPDAVPLKPGDTPREQVVRYRTVGDASCTGAVLSTAATPEEVFAEVAASTLTERGATRADDRVSDSAMEDRKRQGYF